VLELLADNLNRLNETEELDRQGVFQILGIFENMTALEPSVVAKLTEKTKLMKWLLDRIAQGEADANRSYAAELLSILLQQENAARLLFGKLGGIEIVLQACSVSYMIFFFLRIYEDGFLAISPA
jgi:beta-catenin-like protein 1